MSNFLTAPEQLVDELVDFSQRSQALTRLETPGGGRILVRRDWSPERDEVAVLSGGGAGHEPAHAGYIGHGMLTGVIVGDLFASPSVGAIEAAIASVCTPRGCLLVVKNYTGDRLNFGLAAERSRARGLKVEVVLVGDDVSLPDNRQPRGLAGTVLIHRIAGYCASLGQDLAQVHQHASETAASLRTIGLSLGPAQMPGKKAADEQPALGLGIHNEAGAHAIRVESAQHAVDQVISALAPDQGPFHVMVNNLGSCSAQECMLLAKSTLDAFKPDQVASLIGPATFMSALGMHGFSITLLPAGPLMDEALKAPTDAPAWHKPTLIEPVETRPVAAVTPEDGDDISHDEATEAMLRAIASRLIDAQPQLDELDGYSGDGDAGTTFAAGARAVVKALDTATLPSSEWPAMAAKLARLLENSMGGSSGILLSLLLTTAASKGDDGETPARALLCGVAKMQEYGGAQLGDRTLLDALIPALEALANSGSLADAARAARDGAQQTADMSAQAGRAAYVPDKAQRGHIDPGAEAMALIFETLTA